MQYRRFGRTGWPIGEVGYGMWGMAGWTGSDDAESLRSLDRAVELGCNFFDTAAAYGRGHSERLLGQLVRAHPGTRLYTATKDFTRVGLRWQPANQKGPERTMLVPGGGIGAFTSEKIVKPPLRFRLFITLIKGDGDDAPVENLTVEFQG